MSPFYKTVFTFEVLSEEPLDGELTLTDIDYETTEGHWSGRFGDWKHTELTREELIAECDKHGTDPSFFIRCEECGEFFDDNGDKAICKTCEDWMVNQ